MEREREMDKDYDEEEEEEKEDEDDDNDDTVLLKDKNLSIERLVYTSDLQTMATTTTSMVVKQKGSAQLYLENKISKKPQSY